MLLCILKAWQRAWPITRFLSTFADWLVSEVLGGLNHSMTGPVIRRAQHNVWANSSSQKLAQATSVEALWPSPPLPFSFLFPSPNIILRRLCQSKSPVLLASNFKTGVVNLNYQLAHCLTSLSALLRSCMGLGRRSWDNNLNGRNLSG